MDWTLQICNPDGTVRSTITNAAPGGIDDGFKWQVERNRNCVQLTFAGRNDRMGIRLADILKLTVGTQKFFGVVSACPPSDSPNSDTVNAVGGESLLDSRVIPGTAYRNQDVGAIGNSLFQACKPAALSGALANLGASLSLYYAPTATLAKALTDLAKSAGIAGWIVDGAGQIAWDTATPQAVIPDEIATRVVLRIASTLAGQTPGRIADGSGAVITYLPATVTASAQHAQHGTYGREVAVSVPDGVSVSKPQLTGFSTVNSPFMANAGNATDGNDTTYAGSQAGGNVAALSVTSAPATARLLGARVRYSLATSGANPVPNLAPVLSITHQQGGQVVGTYQLAQRADITDVTVIFPPDASMAVAAGDLSNYAWQVALATNGAVYDSEQFRIYALEPIVVDEAAATRLASSFLRLPGAAQTSTTVSGLFQDDTDLTITLYEYEISRKNGAQTVIHRGVVPNGEAGRTIRAQAQQTARSASADAVGLLNGRP